MGTVNLGYVLFAILCFCVGGGLGFVVGRMYQWWTHDELPKVTIPEGYTLRRMPRKKGKEEVEPDGGVGLADGGSYQGSTSDATHRVRVTAIKKESQTAV